MKQVAKFLALVAFLLLLCLNGCADLQKGEGPLGLPLAGQGYDGPIEKLPGQDDAVHIIWKWTYGEQATITPAPPVVWRRGDVCTDDDGNVAQGAFWCPAHKHCCSGFYNVFSAVAYVEAVPNQALSDSALAHELCHAWRVIEGDVSGDETHSSICFKGATDADATAGSLVFEANRRLKVVGL